MLEAPLRIASVACTVLVLLGFGLFAVGEIRAATGDTAAEVAGRKAASRPDPSPREEDARERAHGPMREAIDDANDVLLTPFAFAGEGSGDEWVRRGLPAALALLGYGFGLGLLAGYSRGGAPAPRTRRAYG